ncbi:hypothetical protein NSQ77_21470 [Oceanobacillus sp. FSL K6-2867]|uniref:hypothetical protein n=1 Tax=Oceanobacillus sp. FSL K6-2867 TaxID=2954748 RepID=UPI0030DBA00A
MYTLKKLALYTLIILLLVSIFQDLTINKSSNNENTSDQILNSKLDYSIAHVKVQPGDTIFSIVESINEGNISTFHSENIIEHFRELNPTTDPYKLKPDTFYYFPLYQK